MKVVVEIKGKQYLVAVGDIIKTPRLKIKRNQKIEFTDVKTIIDKDKIITMTQGAKVVGVVLEERKAKKIKVFKFRRRKESKTMKGHRQKYCLVKIEKIIKK